MRIAFPKLLRTWRTTTATIIVAWVVLLVLFSGGRVCSPVLGAQCRAHFLNFIGDLVWLKSLDHWQTLATGGITVLAAFIGGAYIKMQIDHAERIEAQRRARVMTAARSIMPHTMSALLDYIEECGANLLPLLRAAHPIGVLGSATPRPVFPAMPPEILAQLKTMVEASDEATAIPFIALMSELQVFNSRLRLPMRTTAVDIESYVLDAMHVHATAMSFFPFVRDGMPDLPTPGMIAGHYLSSLNMLGFHIEEFPRLFSTAAQRVVRSVSQQAAVA